MLDSTTSAAPIGAYSRPHTLAKLDGRRREAKLLQEARAELVQHVGGKPSAVQRRLIDRAAMLALRLALMDAKAPAGNLTERDAREYLCWNNAYVRTLAQIGLKGAPERTPTLAEHLAARAAAQAAASAPPAPAAAGAVQHSAPAAEPPQRPA